MNFRVIKSSDGKIYDVNSIKNITWKGSVNSGARELNLTLVNNNFVFECGDVIVCMDDFTYQGQIIEKRMSDKQPTITINTMDFMIHLTNSKDTMIVNSTPEGVATQICNKVGILTGEIAYTGVATGEQIFDNRTYYDIINELYKNIDKNLYQLYMNGAYFCVRKKGEVVDYILDDSINCDKIDFEENIKNVINRVLVYDQDNRFISEKNSDNISKYGVFQEVAKEDDNIAEILKEEEKSLKIRAIGNFKCISGNYVRFRDSDTGITALYEITEDTHTVDNNYHSMQLTLEYRSTILK